MKTMYKCSGFSSCMDELTLNALATYQVAGYMNSHRSEAVFVQVLYKVL